MMHIKIESVEQKRRDGEPQHFSFIERVDGADDPVSSSAILDGSVDSVAANAPDRSA